MRVLVTGAGGFSGRHLVTYLVSNHSGDIYCTSPTSKAGKNWFSCDLTEREAVSRLIEQVAPDQIYHLAGLNSNDLDADYRVNVLSARNILETISETQRQCRVLFIGSSAEYGFVPEKDNPVKEDHALAPMSVYGLTKVYQTYLMKFYYSFHNLDVVMARPFNLLGRGAPTNLFIGRVYEQIEAFRAGRTAKIVVGNLENRRDYIPIEQAVRCYALIMQRGKPGEIYNVGSGTSIPIRDLLKRTLEKNGLSMAVVEERKPELLPKFDIKNLVADIAELNKLKMS
jgi:GDP-4-dehydro-6-deoxy-D-mannose reductase